MRNSVDVLKAVLAATAAGTVLGLVSGPVQAGGFAIREQSAQFQGSSFAGNGAGGGLSSMYWNPAALGQAGAGLTSESHASLIFGQAVNTVETINGGPLPASPFSATSGDIASMALVPSSYYAYRLNERLVLGLSINSGFGLSTQPANNTYWGAVLGRKTKLFTMNAAPTLAFQIMPGVTIGAGAQIEYASGKFGFAAGSPGGPTADFKTEDGDFAFGGTAGILIEPAAGTSIGIGYRSQLTHDLEGHFRPGVIPASAEINLPDIVTLSIRQSIAPNMRLLGTVEWSNWSRFKELRLEGVPGINPIPANWSDGWFFSLGGEYDMNPGLTLRAGVAYEISPVDSPEKRFTSIPDNDRFWLSAGATVQLTETMSADFAYSHIFVENGEFERHPATAAVPVFAGISEAQVDIVSASLKMKWGGDRVLEPLK
ncbi:MAG: outer membrane protein transport protein [Hyphomicrobiaceae bacterium]|nr:outer membrane protein transport protein [Hyphomicrobiaceae bacterium]